jgi:AcrR family transcriptional regulator
MAAAKQTLKRKPKGSGHERHAEILDAAHRILLRDGVDATTVRAIAAEIGTSSTALYVYFPTRDAILLALCDRTLAILLTRLAEIEAGPLSNLDKLKSFMRAYVRFGLEHPDEYRMTFAVKAKGIGPVHHTDTPPADGPGSVGPQLFAGLVRQVERLISEGTFAPRDAKSASEMIWMLGHGMIMLISSLPQFPWRNPDEAIADATEIALSGLLKRA